MTRHISIVMPFYENPGMLARHYDAIRAMAPKVREHLKLIIVDDGSPTAPAVPGDCGCSLEIYRVGVDVRWNQDCARNIGVHHAPAGWVLMTDVDHLVPEATLASIQKTDLDEGKVYRFGRVSEPGLETYKPHPNSWLLTKAMFDRIGGYDERFSGLYGTDGEFRDRVRKTAEVMMLKDVLIRVPREVTPDASTVSYRRKQPEDDVGIPRVVAERAKIPNWRPLRLTFPWTRVF